MDMDDDQLIRQFLQSRREEVSDSGFSQRVMRHVPAERPFWMFCVATIAIVAACVALFFWLDGWDALCTLFVKACQAVAVARFSSFNPLYALLLTGFVIWYLADKVKSAC